MYNVQDNNTIIIKMLIQIIFQIKVDLKLVVSCPTSFKETQKRRREVGGTEAARHFSQLLLLLLNRTSSTVSTRPMTFTSCEDVENLIDDSKL